MFVASAILRRPRLSPSASRTLSRPIRSRHGAPVLRWVNASVKPRAASTSSSMSVIRTDGIRRYRSSMSASAPSGTSAVNLSIRNVPSSMLPCGIVPLRAARASRLRAIVSRAFLSASQSCGLEGTASFAFSCAAIIGTSTCLRSP